MWLQRKGDDDMKTIQPQGKNLPKDEVIRCRVSKELKERIETYCQETGKTISDVIIEGINKVIKRK